MSITVDRLGLHHDARGRFAAKGFSAPGASAQLGTVEPGMTAADMAAMDLVSSYFEHRLEGLIDLDQAAQVWDKLYDKQAAGKPNKTALEKWDAHCESRAVKMETHDSLDPTVGAQMAATYRAMIGNPPSDPQTFRAVQKLPEQVGKALRATERQIKSVASFQGVPDEIAQARIAEFRRQYLTDFAHLPADLRPDPPADWATGFSRRDIMATSCPQDPATQYAFFRAQHDPEAFSDAERDGMEYASIDLETAAPVDCKEFFEPSNGEIIEVGVVLYDCEGNEIGRYGQLIRPSDQALATYGTGNVDLHGINVDDVIDEPSWPTVAPEVLGVLAGRRMIAQNDRFERSWIAHHSEALGLTFDKRMPGCDTQQIAAQHLAAENQKLATTCEALGIAYTNGHRATHDAHVAGQAFFAMKRRAHDLWRNNPRYATTPHPTR